MNFQVKLDIPSNFMYEPVNALNGPKIIRKLREAANRFEPLKRHLKNADIAVLLDYNDSSSLELWDEKTEKSILHMKVDHSKDDNFRIVPINPVSLMKDIIRTRQAPYIFVRRGLPKARDIREERARETLLRIIGEEAYRYFLKNGFVSVQNPKSKRVYQIFTGCELVNVYKDGKKIERLCTHLPYGFPPTDSLIVRYLLAINDEERLWKMSNKHGVLEAKSTVREVDRRSLPEIFKSLKQTQIQMAA